MAAKVGVLANEQRALLANEQSSSAVPVGIPVTTATAQPVPQTMARAVPPQHWQEMLAPTPALVMRERVSLLQFMFGACEKRTSFAVGGYPSMGSAPAPDALHAHLDDEAFKAAMNSQGLFEVREDSTCLCRYCCHQHRELRLGIFPARPPGPGDALDLEMQGGLGGLGWPEGEVPSLQLLRPFKCSMPCCCCMLHPQEMSALDTGSKELLGKTVMDWSCWLCIAPCLCVPRLRYTVSDAAGKPEVDVHVPLCFTDGCVNCCAPTCFNSVLLMPVTAPGDTAEIGSIQSHWPGCNVRGICCAGNANNNYAVVFPPQSTAEQKARLLSAVHLIDLNLFERRGNQK